MLGGGRKPKRAAIVLATAAAAFSNGALKVKQVLRALMPGVRWEHVSRHQERWMPQFLLLGHINDTARPGRKRASACMSEETALLAAGAAVSGYEQEGRVEPMRDAADVARRSTAFQAAMAECAQHGITRPETVLRGVSEVVGVDIRSRQVKQWQPTGVENEYDRGVCACNNLTLFTTWIEDKDGTEDEPVPPYTIKPKLWTLVQLDSKKLYVTSALSHKQVLCGPNDPVLYHGLDDDRLRTAREAVINYYIAVSPLVGVLALVFVSGTTGLETGYQVSPYSTLCASCCGRASRQQRPWPGVPVR